MSERAKNLTTILEQISVACERSGRNIAEVELIAVSKTFPKEAVAEVLPTGHQQFGESRIQEAQEKVERLPAGLEWHFIGRVQRNKVRKILPYFPIIHAVDSMRLAETIDRIAGELELRPKIFVQVNIGEEDSKGGFTPELTLDAVKEISQMPHVQVAGLMCIPPATDTSEGARPYFKKMAKMAGKIVDEGILPKVALSMGMSSDFEVAIEEGATHVRVGSSIFGVRTAKIPGELG